MEKQIKPCEVCGEPIPWAVGDYSKRYVKKKFCSRSCANKARRVWADVSEYNKWYASVYADKRRIQKAEWYQKHKQIEQDRRNQWRSDNPEYHAEWKRRNSRKICVYEQNRRTRIKENGGSFTEEEWVNKLEEHGYRCAICGMRDDEKKLTIDHIVPISKGGGNDISNIQPLCSMCNCKKAAS